MTLAELTPAQRTVALLLADGELTFKDLAYRLGISPRTLSQHSWAIYSRTGTHTRVQLANWVKAEEIATLTQAIADRDLRLERLTAFVRLQAAALEEIQTGPLAAG